MPTKKMCVVCGFALPRLQRTDTEYCGSTCRVRSHRARKREIYRERWEELRRLYREIRERELIRPLSGRYPFPLRARRSIAALEVQIQELLGVLAGERQQHAITEQRLAETEAQTSGASNTAAEEIERLQEYQRDLERAWKATERELERAREEADEERHRANQAERQLQDAELRVQELEKEIAARDQLPIEPVSVLSQRESKLLSLIQAERKESAKERRSYLAAQSSSSTHTEALSKQLSALQTELVQTQTALSQETNRSERLQEGTVQMRAALRRESAGRIGAQNAVGEGRVAFDRVKKQRDSLFQHARDVSAEHEVRTKGESKPSLNSPRNGTKRGRKRPKRERIWRREWRTCRSTSRGSRGISRSSFAERRVRFRSIVSTAPTTPIWTRW
jgi:chromosome segregation ATPase